MNGVLDRIENGVAVILIEAENRELTIPVTDLPAESKVGTWFSIKMKHNQLDTITIDPSQTEKQREKISLLKQQLQRKKRSSKFKR